MQTDKEYLATRELSPLRCESVGEYSLPDYNTDVKKLLLVKTKVFPSGRFVSDDMLEFSGSVGYEAVYLDAENNVTHAEFSTDYEATVRISSESYVDSDIKTAVSSCSVRLVGPRKLSVKCSLDSDVSICERREYAVDGDAFREYVPETLELSANVQSLSFASGEAREMSEEMLSIEGAIADEVEVLLTDLKHTVHSLEMSDNGVGMKGEIQLSVLIRNGDEPPRLVSKRIPFAEEISIADQNSLDALDGRLECSYIKSSIVPTDDGVCVSASFSITPRIYGRKNCRVELVRDAYLKERGTDNEYTDFGYNEHICSTAEEKTFEVKRPLSELGVEYCGDVIYAEAQARIERCDILDECVKMDGEIRFSGIACRTNEEDVRVCYPFKFALPFVENVNINCQIHSNMRANCAVNVNDIKINMDENNVNIDAELTLFATLTAEKRQRCLGASYLTDEEFLRDDSVVTVYYPEPSESLFGIAKRFHTSVTEIAESNRLSQSTFASLGMPIGGTDIKKLLIK